MTTVKLAFDDLSPAEAIRITELYASMRMPRTRDIERTAAEVATTPPAPVYIPAPGNVNPTQPPVLATPAPVAAPTISSAPVIAPALAAAAGMMTDERGVPWHADYHATPASKNNDGSWRAKRGVDKATVKAYAAQFIAGKGNAAAVATPAVPSVANTKANSAPAADVGNGAPPAVTNGAGATSADAAPSMHEIQGMWSKLCAANKVNEAHKNWLTEKFEGDLMAGVGNVFAFNPQKRIEAHAVLAGWLAA
jgi:hypothetical protein